MPQVAAIDLRKSDCFLPEQQGTYLEFLLEAEKAIERNRDHYRKFGFLVCETDSLKTLAQIAAGLSQEIAVFLGNPTWRQTEWAQVKSQDVPGPLGQAAAKRVVKVLPQPGEVHIPTGGSSGAIKFARHSLETLRHAAEALYQFFGNQAIHSWCSLPTYHISGLMPWIRALVSGGAVVYEMKMVDVSSFPNTGLKTTSIVGAQLARALESESITSWKKYDIVFIGGAPVSHSLLDRAREAGIPLAPCYGSTETAAMISCLRPSEFLSGKLNAGKLLPHVSISFDEAQSMTISSKSLFFGYWGRRHDRSNASWQTDDLGNMDADGYLQLHGRADRIIISGGEKVDPEQVEQAISKLKGVKDAMIVPEKHPEWGSQVVCIFQTDGSQVSSNTLKAALRPVLSSFKLPKKWICVDNMPYNAQGKRDPLRIAQLLKTYATSGQN